MNGEGCPQPLRRLRRHLPMNGEEPVRMPSAPPAASPPPPHEWEEPVRMPSAPPAASPPPPHEWGGMPSAPPAASPPPPHEWGGAGEDALSPSGGFAATSP